MRPSVSRILIASLTATYPYALATRLRAAQSVTDWTKLGRHAPVGYVAALRESSVVLGALAGWRLLGEGDHRRRILAALIVLAGLITLVAAAT